MPEPEFEPPPGAWLRVPRLKSGPASPAPSEAPSLRAIRVPRDKGWGEPLSCPPDRSPELPPDALPLKGSPPLLANEPRKCVRDDLPGKPPPSEERAPPACSSGLKRFEAGAEAPELFLLGCEVLESNERLRLDLSPGAPAEPEASLLAARRLDRECAREEAGFKGASVWRARAVAEERGSLTGVVAWGVGAAVGSGVGSGARVGWGGGVGRGSAVGLGSVVGTGSAVARAWGFSRVGRGSGLGWRRDLGGGASTCSGGFVGWGALVGSGLVGRALGGGVGLGASVGLGSGFGVGSLRSSSMSCSCLGGRGWRHISASISACKATEPARAAGKRCFQLDGSRRSRGAPLASRARESGAWGGWARGVGEGEGVPEGVWRGVSVGMRVGGLGGAQSGSLVPSATLGSPDCLAMSMMRTTRLYSMFSSPLITTRVSG